MKPKTTQPMKGKAVGALSARSDLQQARSTLSTLQSLLSTLSSKLEEARSLLLDAGYQGLMQRVDELKGSLTQEILKTEGFIRLEEATPQPPENPPLPDPPGLPGPPGRPRPDPPGFPGPIRQPVRSPGSRGVQVHGSS